MREGPGTKQDGNQLLVFKRNAKTPSTKLDLVTREFLVHNRGQQVGWLCCSRDSCSRCSSRASASVAAARSTRTASCGDAEPSRTSTRRPQSTPLAPTVATTQPRSSSAELLPVCATERDLDSQRSSTASAEAPAASKARTWWLRFSKTTGAFAMRAV